MNERTLLLLLRSLPKHLAAMIIMFGLAPLMPATAMVSAQTDDWRVVEQRLIGLGGQAVLRLSPDGRSLATFNEGDDLCVYDFAFLTEIACADLEGNGITSVDRRTIVWAPDNSRLAFTENYTQFFHESDIWIMRAFDGQLENLTDDGITGGVAFEDPRPSHSIDLSPVWSPDSSSVWFFRTSVESDEDTEYSELGTSLLTKELTEDKPKTLAEIDRSAWAVTMGAHVSKDGDALWFTKYTSEATTRGIFEFSLSSKTLTQLTTTPNGAFSTVLQVSGLSQAIEVVSHADGWEFRLVDLETSRATSMAPTPSVVHHATFSQDGKTVLLVRRADNPVSVARPGELVAVSLTTGRSDVLITDLLGGSTRDPFEPILTLSDQGSIYLPIVDQLVWLEHHSEA